MTLFNSNDIVIINNQPLTTPGRSYKILYTQIRSRTPHDPPELGEFIQWIAYTNDAGVTDFVRSSQCKLKDN